MKEGYVQVNSGKLQGFAYECYVLATANKLVKDFGMTKTEAIKEVKKQLPREKCIVTVKETHAYI